MDVPGAAVNPVPYVRIARRLNETPFRANSVVWVPSDEIATRLESTRSGLMISRELTDIYLRWNRMLVCARGFNEREGPLAGVLGEPGRDEYIKVQEELTGKIKRPQ
ncbi:hypothetical protein COCON_G00160820 [Conger conger]|uniref:Uncharacterized protein n=1 Tax=Conger conger TaxID=82655 RepID=A0A9Q1DA94_CONCO|nr:hypothetical protein COCON_G00160820 [Conger conger]